MAMQYPIRSECEFIIKRTTPLLCRQLPVCGQGSSSSQELAATVRVRPLTNKYVATAVAVGLGGLVAMLPASEKMGPGSGGMILWPLFGATNQLLAGLAFMVTVFYLWRRNKPIWFAAAPMVVMLIMPAWAMFTTKNRG